MLMAMYPEQERSRAGSRFTHLSFYTDVLPLLSQHFTTSLSLQLLPLCYIYSVTHLSWPVLTERNSLIKKTPLPTSEPERKGEGRSKRGVGREEGGREGKRRENLQVERSAR